MRLVNLYQTSLAQTSYVSENPFLHTEYLGIGDPRTLALAASIHMYIAILGLAVTKRIERVSVGIYCSIRIMPRVTKIYLR